MRQQAELVEASKHLAYEAEMLLGCVKAYQYTAWLDDEYFAVVQNALVESFTIHVRNLISFLYHERGRKDDVLAVHFFPNPQTWQALISPKKQQEAIALSDLISQYTAHLTLVRQKSIQWNLNHIAEEIGDTLILFIENVPSGLIDPQMLIWETSYKNRSRSIYPGYTHYVEG